MSKEASIIYEELKELESNLDTDKYIVILNKKTYEEFKKYLFPSHVRVEPYKICGFILLIGYQQKEDWKLMSIRHLPDWYGN